jgi:hypothetical protein
MSIPPWTLTGRVDHDGGMLPTARQHPGGYLPRASKYSLRNILDRRVQASARKLARPFGSNDVRHSRYREILIETSPPWTLPRLIGTEIDYCARPI